ncbi:MAG: N-acetylneuraminate synthase [Hyphococcus sp.]|nr:MAG: N-acetylneuraminate synthase [Marinicaulis sp.]
MTPLNEWFSPSAPCIFIAEIGVNHNGNLDTAKRLIDAAVDAGADAVKFQTFIAEKLATRHATKAAYQEKNDAAVETQATMLKRLEFSEEKLLACRDHARNAGIGFLSTPFDKHAADLLEKIGVEAFKISSGDLTELPLLRHIASKATPMIISTGMANLSEVEEAVTAIAEAGDPPLAILHCVSDYPAAPHEANLRAMDTLAAAFGKPVGWSDHTLGDEVAIAAVARGARFIEKHYTLDRNMPGPDHKASLEPHELKDLIAKIRRVESALGDGIKRPQASELATAAVARKSIVLAHDVKVGERLDESMLACKRPGTGLAPRLLPLIIGRTATRDLAADELLHLEDIS